MNDLSLPSNWSVAKLSDLGTEVRGSARPVQSQKYEVYSVPAFPTGQPEILDGSEIGSIKRPVLPGDVLICKINPRINRVWLVKEASHGLKQIASTEWLVLRVPEPDRAPLVEYLTWYLRGPTFRDWIKLNVEGATGSHTRAKSPIVLRQIVPIPPPAEQRRIVSAIDEHFSRLDAAEAALRASRARNSRLRRALLARLGAGMKPIALGDVSIEARYGTSIRCSYDGPGWPVLRIPNIQNGHIDMHDMKYASEPNTDLKPYQIERGDLLFVRTNGSRDLIGRVAVVDTDDRLAFASYLIRVRPDQRRLDARFAALALASPQCREQIETKTATTAGQYNLNLRSIATLAIPLPPIEEQRRLTTEIESELTVLDLVSRTIDQTLLRSQSLRRSILDQAFAGALVPQNPDESVSTHLAEDQGGLTVGRLRRRKMND